MTSEAGQGVDKPVAEMTLKEKMQEVRRFSHNVRHCLNQEIVHHDEYVGHKTWVEVIQPLIGLSNQLAEVANGLYQDIRNLPDPAAPAPQDPPAGDPPPIDPADLSKGYTPPPADGDGQES